MKKKNNNILIDFVITWVDGSDPAWIEKKNTYKHDCDGAKKQRYRDWGFLKYWFRAIEANAPWVNTIFFVTDNQIPDFLNLSNKKLVIVNHEHFIPRNYLPTFSANSIEINFHRIKNLSNYFVYFNDDMFLNRPIKATFFFKRELPRYTYIERHIPLSESYMSNIVLNDMNVVNSLIKHRAILKHPFKLLNYRYGKYGVKNLLTLFKKEYGIFEDDHLPCPFLKTTFVELWKEKNDLFDKTSINKFRTIDDVNQYVFKYYDLARGHFYPKWVKHGGYYLLCSDNVIDVASDIISKRNQMICLNDNDYIDEKDYMLIQNRIIKAFDKRYPNKSSFEK